MISDLPRMPILNPLVTALTYRPAVTISPLSPVSERRARWDGKVVCPPLQNARKSKNQD